MQWSEQCEQPIFIKVIRLIAMAQQIAVSPELAEGFPDVEKAIRPISPDLAYRRLAIVNVVFFGEARARDREWTLVDAGIPGSAAAIAKAAAQRFGERSRPAAIIMTHGHFDHVGALCELAETWDVPVFAHRREFPYLNGSESYPRPNISAGGGIMTWLSPLFPRHPIDVRSRLQVLPDSGDVPGMRGWQWLETPGHSPGHISLWRESDRALIAGDACVTTAQESVYAVLTQKPEMHGPPRYFTHDWVAAKASVKRLAELGPELLIAGHGPAMHGPGVRDALRQLAKRFDSVALPKDD